MDLVYNASIYKKKKSWNFQFSCLWYQCGWNMWNVYNFSHLKKADLEMAILELLRSHLTKPNDNGQSRKEKGSPWNYANFAEENNIVPGRISSRKEVKWGEICISLLLFIFSIIANRFFNHTIYPGFSFPCLDSFYILYTSVPPPS